MATTENVSFITVTILIMSVLVITVTLSNDVSNVTSSHRDRRALIFPSGTVLQLSLGMSMPVSIPNRTLAISFAFQMVFNLPTNATIWHTAPDLGKRSVSKTGLLDIYLPLEAFLEDHGFEGRTCLLRSICEAAYLPFHYEDMDLLEEVAHAILTPSEELTPGDADCKEISYVMDYLPPEKRYLAAECLGRYDGDCRAAYRDCPRSPLDFISQKISYGVFSE
ncbi:uncharacterized protein [Periplaneta americana]|uniref:uncharacterized protein n=1 Tax=Periplaneta americana TaxID=6978 RepID=UPI0037E8E794